MSAAPSTPSETTTSPRPVSLPTGPQLGGPGAVTTANSPVKTALQALEPDQVRREVRALVERRWPSLQRTVNGDYDLTGFRLVSPITDDQRQEILSLSRALTKPADPELVIEEITRCLTVTKSRPKEEADLTLMVAAFTEALSKCPADLVVSSLRKWSETSPWWPSLAEILQPIRGEIAWRNSLAEAANARLRPAEAPAETSQTRYGPAAQKLFKDTIAKMKSDLAASKPKPVVLPDVTVPMPRPPAPEPPAQAETEA